MGKKSISKDIDKNSAEYLEKRMKNNSAVKRSRDKTKAKALEASTRVQKLQIENEQLQNTVDNMTAELKYLKEMLICQAGTSEYLSPGTEADIEYILRDDIPTDLNRFAKVISEMRRVQTIVENNNRIEQSSTSTSSNDFQLPMSNSLSEFPFSNDLTNESRLDYQHLPSSLNFN